MCVHWCVCVCGVSVVCTKAGGDAGCPVMSLSWSFTESGGRLAASKPQRPTALGL